MSFHPPPMPPPLPIRRPPFLVHAVLPAIFAWVAAFVALVTGFLLTEGLRRYPGQSTEKLVESLVLTLLLFAVLSCVVVVGTCWLIVAPLLRLLPRSSPLWSPPVAVAVGVGVGLCAIYLWMSFFSGQLIVPDFQDRSMVPFAAAAGLSGAIFAGLFARAVRRNSA